MKLGAPVREHDGKVFCFIEVGKDRATYAQFNYTTPPDPKPPTKAVQTVTGPDGQSYPVFIYIIMMQPNASSTAYVKQVTAAGFQLKGSGWYVTDFRGDKKAGDDSMALDGCERLGPTALLEHRGANLCQVGEMAALDRRRHSSPRSANDTACPWPTTR